MRVPQSLLVHVATVRPAAGESSTGLQYGATFTLRCFASVQRKLVRDADGNQVLSTLTLVADPGRAESIPPGSEVTCNGTTATVMTSINQDSGGLGAPDHTEVSCG